MLAIYSAAIMYDVWLAYLAPLWLFKQAYAPATEAVREREEIVRNTVRRTAYRLRRVQHERRCR